MDDISGSRAREGIYELVPAVVLARVWVIFHDCGYGIQLNVGGEATPHVGSSEGEDCRVR